MFALIFIVHVRCGGRRRVILLVSFISTVEFSPSAWPRYETSGVFVCPKCFPHRTWLIPDRPNWLPFKPALTRLRHLLSKRVRSRLIDRLSLPVTASAADVLKEAL